MDFINFTNYLNLKTFKALLKHPLISGSSVILIGSFLANIFNYLFNLAMGRMLPVEDYGLLTSLMSLMAMLTIFGIVFTKMFAKLAARYAAKDQSGHLKFLITKGTEYVTIISAAFLVILLVFTNFIKNFLHVDNNLLIFLIFITIFFGLISAIPKGVLQGNLRFYTHSFLEIFQAIIKFSLAVVFVFAGFKILGALAGVLISVFLSLVLGYSIISKYVFKVEEKKLNIAKFRKEFSHYTYSFLLAALGITLLANTDIILVRHFFEETVSGQYAALSLMGKAIFYLVMPINFVFFPLIAQKKERNERLFNTVMMTWSLVFVVSIAVSFIYFAFPSLILGIFFPAPEYQVLKSYLGVFSLYILLFSMVNIMNSFFLSIGKTKIYLLTLGAAIVQIGLIYTIFHNSLYQVIGVLFLTNFLLLVVCLIYYMKHGKD